MSADEIIDKNKVKIKLLCVFALVFSLGFGCGYYFIDATKSEAEVTIRDKSASCAELFEKSPPAAAMAGASSSAPKSAGTQESAGAVLSSSDAKVVSGAEAANGQFAGSKNSTLYHTKNCQYVKRIKPENVVWFGSAAEAQAAGRTPHSCGK